MISENKDENIIDEKLDKNKSKKGEKLIEEEKKENIILKIDKINIEIKNIEKPESKKNILKETMKKTIRRKSNFEEYEKIIKHNVLFVKICILISIIINVLDIIVIIFLPSIFLDVINIISLSIITISLIFILVKYILKNEISASYYKNMNQIITYTSVILIIFFFNVLYIMINKIMLNSIKEFDSNEILLGIILMLIYSFINVFFPILILIKLGELKTQIKKIGLIKNNNNLDSSGTSSIQNFIAQQKEHSPMNKLSNSNNLTINKKKKNDKTMNI